MKYQLERQEAVIKPTAVYDRTAQATIRAFRAKKFLEPHLLVFGSWSAGSLSRQKGGGMAQISLNTRISPSTFDMLCRYAASTGMSKASIVEAALKAYLEKKQEKTK